MIIIGLTGGIASGKSLVGRIFRDLGAHLIDADAIAHELLGPDQPAAQEVVAHFGPEICGPDNCVDRRRLGEIVFNDREQREWLNRCLHPKVFEVYASRVRQLRDRQPDAIVVLDAALIIETGYYKHMDCVVVVDADEEQQLERLIARDGFSREQALARIRSQMPLREKRQYADYVIDNRRSREETERQAREIFAACKQDAEKNR